MANFADDLRTMLEHEAVRVSPDPARRATTVTRAARTRMVRGWGAGVAVTVAALAAISGAGAVVPGPDGDRSLPASQSSPTPSSRREAHPEHGRAGDAIGCPDDHAGETREPGDGSFPVLGRGTFDGRRWALTLIEDPDAAHPEDLESENPEIALEIEGGWPNGGSMETYSRWNGVSPPFHGLLRGGFAYAFGMAAAEAATVTIEPESGDPVEAELFDARGVPRPGSQVYVAFLPGDATGDVVARDGAGDEIARVSLPPLPRSGICE